MKKREWVYIHQPADYEMSCDKCNSNNITWSEFESLIWCYDCEIDTKGNEGIFGGPIGIGICELFGLSFNRVRLSDGKLLKIKFDGPKIIWEE